MRLPPGAFAGTDALVRAHLRRDRWMVPWWALGITLLYWSQAISIDGLYATQAELDTAAASMAGNTAMIAMAGPARALNTVGGQVTWQASAFGAISIGLLSMFLVGRHTRAEEESGRDELVRAGAVGRYAPPAAALVVAVLADLVVGLLVAASLIAYPLAVADSLALGLGLSLVGLCFTATALVAVQLSASTRSAYGLAGLVLGVAYVLRAIGDVGNTTLTWLSPIGWYQGMHAFSGVRWWPALLLFAGTLLGLVVAGVLLRRRDIGSGIWPARPGPPRAGRWLGTGWGLTWRLQRAAVLGWAGGIFVTGIAYGTIGDDVESLLGDSETTVQLITQGLPDPVDGFYATALLMLVLISAGFAISSVNRTRGEEEAGHAEVLLATGLSRRRWLASYVAVTVVGTSIVVAGAGLGVGIGYALVTGDGGAVVRYVLPALSYLPGVLVLSALARLVQGVAPHLAWLTWTPLVLAVVVMFFGELLHLPGWLQALSPFHHLAAAPAVPVDWGSLLGVLAVAAGVSFVAQLAYRRRDIG